MRLTAAQEAAPQQVGGAEMEKLSGKSAAMMALCWITLGGLTLTASLSFDKAVHATFDFFYPDPDDVDQRLRKKWIYRYHDFK